MNPPSKCVSSLRTIMSEKTQNSGLRELQLPLTFYGPIISPRNALQYDTFPRCLLAIGATGSIDWMIADISLDDIPSTLESKGWPNVEVCILRPGEFLLPGLVDTHTHACQFPCLGTGQSYELLDWLKHVAFPIQARFSDAEFGRKTYESVVRRLIDCGTTTCCYYTTVHVESTKILADLVYAAGQRGFVGKCDMDRRFEPSPSIAFEGTKHTIDYIRSLATSDAVAPSKVVSTSPLLPLLQPILTPSAASGCTETLMRSIGEYAKLNRDIPIQAHIAESKGEMALGLELFPNAKHYAEIYDSLGLLQDNTILAHGIHLSDDELDLIKKRGVGISHCPTSNFNLRSGIAPIGKYLDRGIKVGLGTDVSAGFSPSILTAIQSASMASKALSFTTSPSTSGALNGQTFENQQLPLSTLLYLATLGGAEVCSLENHVGSFVEGKAFDALLVSTSGDKLGPGFWDPSMISKEEGRGITGDVMNEWLERFLFTGDDRNIEKVFVQGRWIGGRAWHPE